MDKTELERKVLNLEKEGFKEQEIREVMRDEGYSNRIIKEVFRDLKDASTQRTQTRGQKENYPKPKKSAENYR